MSRTDKKAFNTGMERSRTTFVSCSDVNAIVSLTCFPLACSDGNGTEPFYLKRSRLNAALQRSTFRNNAERLRFRVDGALVSQRVGNCNIILVEREREREREREEIYIKSLNEDLIV